MADTLAPAGASPSVPPTRPRLTFLDLPEETQQEIFAHCDTADLICLSLVSHRFRELAAEQLYHSLHVVFPNENDRRSQDTMNDLPISLDTLTTSDYNYAQHLREFCFDTVNTGILAENSYKNYHYSRSAGKFLNTLVLLALRKAKKLETLIWNVRIEISRPLYKVLHRIDTLVNLELRLQAGPSLYESLPPLPNVPNSPVLSSTSTSSSTITVTPPEATIPTTSLPQSFLYPPGSGLFSNPAPPPIYYPGTSSGSSPSSSLPKPSYRAKAPKVPSTAPEPPTISGFKNLKTLGILDIDSLDVITEIKTCVRNSAGTLTELRLSFSDSLAHKSRNPSPDLDNDDSELDDEFQPLPPMPVVVSEPASVPSKYLHTQEEKRNQESALGRIFDVEPYVIKSSKKGSDPLDKNAASSESETEATKEKETADGATYAAEFVDAVRNATAYLTGDAADEEEADEKKRKEALDLIVAAAKKYILTEETKGGAEAVELAEASGSGSGSGSAVGSGNHSSSKPGSQDDAEMDVDNKVSAQESSSLFKDTPLSPTKLKDVDRDVCPEDIDIEEPEGQLVLDPQDSSSDKDTEPLTDSASDLAASAAPTGNSQGEETNSADNNSDQGNSLNAQVQSCQSQATKTQRPETSDKKTDANISKLSSNLAAQKANYQLLLDKLSMFESLSHRMSEKIKKLRNADGPSLDSEALTEVETQMLTFSTNVNDLYREIRTVEAEVHDVEKQIRSLTASKEAEKTTATGTEDKNRRLINEYVRSTRGLALRVLEIHLIPVKASVLSKAIDLRVLKGITLLNVGPQAPIWTLLAKENKVHPLPLRTIHTDNVTNAFLNFVSQLEKVRNLHLLERDAKYRPQSLTPQTTTSIDDIRRLVLRKHAPHLRSLSIQNLATEDWDMDEATVKLLSRRAKSLEELAISMNMQSIHAFLQHLPGFTRLIALHVIRLRNDDTCVWVMQETKRFLVDTLSHYPHLQLEYLAIDSNTTAEHITRVDVKKERAKKKEKKKAQTAKIKGKEKATSGALSVGGGAGTFNYNGFPNASVPGAGSIIWNTNNSNNLSGNAFTTIPISDTIHHHRSSDTETDEDDDSDLSDSAAYGRRTILKLKPVRMSSIWSVDIFTKEIITGRL